MGLDADAKLIWHLSLVYVVSWTAIIISPNCPVFRRPSGIQLQGGGARGRLVGDTGEGGHSVDPHAALQQA